MTGRKAWERAAYEYATLANALGSIGPARARAMIYSRMLKLNKTLAASVDLETMPPLEPGDGTSYAQAYADAAELLSLLADGERRFGNPRPAAARGPRRATIGETALWDRYMTSTDRSERSEILIELYETTSRRVGYEGADPLNTAALSERAISASAPTRR